MNAVATALLQRASNARPYNVVVTFALVTLAWVFFRAASVTDALILLSRLPSGWDLATLRTTLLTLGALPAARLAVGAVCLHFLPEKPADLTPRTLLGVCLLALAVVAAWFAALHAGAANAFIYFQF